MPVGVYTRVYSPTEKGFASEDDEVLRALKFLGKHFKKSNIRAFDRGYDANVYYEHLLKNKEKFIIRAKKNRDVIYKVVTKIHLMRWRIEEFYRFKKQQFGFEDFRVRSIRSIRNIDLLLTIAIGYIGIISEKHDKRRIVMELINISKRIYSVPKFVFYAIADGLFTVLAKCKQGISDMLQKPPKTTQLSFVTYIGFM